jgi:RNA polymerase sigma-70 factor (ECF subfamily)
MGDEDLVLLAADGDAGAFAALYDRHSRAAYSLAYRMTGERHAAEDLAQEAFLRVWRSVGGYRPGRGSVRAWVLSIVQNRGIDQLRSSASRGRTRRKAEAEATGNYGAPSEAFDRAWRNHRRQRTLEALRDLPREQREVLALLHFRGLTQAEVSERLGLPLGTVKGRSRLGLRKLRGHAKLRGMAVE